MFVDKIHLLSSKLVQILGIDGTRRLYDIPPLCLAFGKSIETEMSSRRYSSGK